VKAVDGVSFTIRRGETLGLVGESGCGKSTTGRSILQLNDPTAGEVLFNGENIAGWNVNQMRPLRRQMQLIFQDPYSSLNPRMTCGSIIGEPLIVHGLTGSKNEYRERVANLLENVGLNPFMADRYPHEFSGDQTQSYLTLCLSGRLQMTIPAGTCLVLIQLFCWVLAYTQ
jgi:ABC-type microcin C transport system duplicated ATPase subunit YejF